MKNLIKKKVNQLIIESGKIIAGYTFIGILYLLTFIIDPDPEKTKQKQS